MADQRMTIPYAEQMLRDADYYVKRKPDRLVVTRACSTSLAYVHINAGPPGGAPTVSKQAVITLVNKARKKSVQNFPLLYSVHMVKHAETVYKGRTERAYDYFTDTKSSQDEAIRAAKLYCETSHADEITVVTLVATAVRKFK